MLDKLGQQINNYAHSNDSGKNGIHTRNLYLTYTDSGDNILNGVDISIRKGEIYALLGPSGCGKTTLLRCIVGVKKANYGDVKVFNNIPGTNSSIRIPGTDVGYMPQEIALYIDLTIYEQLNYVGKIFQLRQSYINKRIKELGELLDLPEYSRTIKTLSGGQQVRLLHSITYNHQRRVSFAATVMHLPKLIVLDEPTAGVDPMLREKIWLTLIKMKKDHGITFIITTHYIEEARRAEKIGFMRKGRILCEGVPDNLLRQYNCKTLEDVFLKICLNKRKSTITTPDQLNSFKQAYQNDKILTENNLKMRQNRKRSIFTPSQQLPAVTFSEDACSINGIDKGSIFGPDDELSVIQCILLWLTVLYALLRKNLVQDLSDSLQVSFQYISPISQVILFALCIGRNPIGIEIGVISKDFSFLNFSHEYLGVMNPEFIHLNYYDNYTKAIEDARNLRLWAVMSFDRHYSHAFLDRAAYNVSNISIKNSTIVINADLTNKIVTDLTYKLLSKYYNAFVSKEFKKYDVDAKYALSYIEYPEILFGDNKDEHYTGYMNLSVGKKFDG